MDKKKVIAIIIAIVMAAHEISEIITGGHDSSTFSFLNIIETANYAKEKE